VIRVRRDAETSSVEVTTNESAARSRYMMDGAILLRRSRKVFPDPIVLSSQNDASPNIVARNAADRQISPSRSAECGASTSIRRTRERRKDNVGVCNSLTFARWGFSRLLHILKSRGMFLRLSLNLFANS